VGVNCRPELGHARIHQESKVRGSILATNERQVDKARRGRRGAQRRQLPGRRLRETAKASGPHGATGQPSRWKSMLG
jgi:hypothetical protein